MPRLTHLSLVLEGQHPGEVFEREGGRAFLHAVGTVKHPECLSPKQREVAMQDAGIQECSRSVGREGVKGRGRGEGGGGEEGRGGRGGRRGEGGEEGGGEGGEEGGGGRRVRKGGGEEGGGEGERKEERREEKREGR